MSAVAGTSAGGTLAARTSRTGKGWFTRKKRAVARRALLAWWKCKGRSGSAKIR